MRLRFGALSVLALCALASCSPESRPPSALSSPTVATAVVIGGISPCEGIPIANGPRYAAGTVTVLRGQVTWRSVGADTWEAIFPTSVAGRASVAENGTYRFVLPPGHYVLRAAFPPPANVQPYREVSVRAGSTVQAGIPDMCM